MEDWFDLAWLDWLGPLYWGQWTDALSRELPSTVFSPKVPFYPYNMAHQHQDPLHWHGIPDVAVLSTFSSQFIVWVFMIVISNHQINIRSFFCSIWREMITWLWTQNRTGWTQCCHLTLNFKFWSTMHKRISFVTFYLWNRIFHINWFERILLFLDATTGCCFQPTHKY